MNRQALVSTLIFAATLPAVAQPNPVDETLGEVEPLRGASEAWAQIPWLRCLGDAYAESRATGKPVFMVAIAGDPTGRC